MDRYKTAKRPCLSVLVVGLFKAVNPAFLALNGSFFFTHSNGLDGIISHTACILQFGKSTISLLHEDSVAKMAVLRAFV
jgi:hypothetical protein